jgi:hypothetical protein
VLTTLLQSIQTQLTTASKSFVLTALLPLTVFLLANAGFLYRISEDFRSWLASPNASSALVLTTIALVWISLAYILSALNPTLLEAIEGKYPPISWFTGWLHARHWEQRRIAQSQYIHHGKQEAEFNQSSEKWKTRLMKARKKGQATKLCTNDLKTTIVGLVIKKTKRGSVVSVNEFETAVQELETLLLTNSTELQCRESKILQSIYYDLLRCFDYGWSRHRFERIRIYNLLQFKYPGPFEGKEAYSSAGNLAPTTIGNIGRTARSYALSRYNMDLDIFWTRLQKTLRGAKEFYDVLQDSKTIVDSLVALTWLAGLFTLIWMIVLPWVATSESDFLFVGIAGPILTIGIYTLACRSYLVFTDLLRSAVDIYRFNLLKDLHVPMPYGSDEEKRLWGQLGGLTGYGTELPLIYDCSKT